MTCSRCEQITNRQLAAVARGCITVGPLEANIYGELLCRDEPMPRLAPTIQNTIIALVWRYPGYITARQVGISTTMLRNRIHIARRFLVSYVPEVEIVTVDTMSVAAYKLHYSLNGERVGHE